MEGPVKSQGAASDSWRAAFQAPAISLPKGGGAVRGMGEKFAANPVTGSASFSIPLPASPGRGGFGPQLALNYDSGSGNGPFGFGWNLGLSAITRKTDKGLPQYQDARDSDVFLLLGVEDLVPTLQKSAGGEWVDVEEPRGDYRVRRYRPRIEGLFARIERWSHRSDPSDVYWRSVTRDNITTCYGRSPESRIADPSDPSRIFSWLICETYDDKGNAMVYRYKGEDAVAVDLGAANERNRIRSAQRYLKSIQYCNRTPRAASEDLSQRTDWLLEQVFDYGEHDAMNPRPTDAAPWPCRRDGFSNYRSGFEVRTHRLCRRVLMFHHFAEEDIGRDCLVRSLDLEYRDDNPIASFIVSATQSGHRRNGAAGYLTRSLPPLQFEYSEARIQTQIQEVDALSLQNAPTGLSGIYQWVDLDGDGIPGILSEQADAWFYKRNTSALATGVASFAAMERVAEKPAYASTEAGGWQWQDLAGDGQPDLVRFAAPASGFFERGKQGAEGAHDGWNNFVAFRELPQVNWRDPNLRFVDLTGDGLADILITEDQASIWHHSLGETGFAPSKRATQALDEEHGPRLVFADAEQSIYLADFSGDGLTDLVRIRNGEVCYWPNLGYGRFGAKVSMDNSPWFDHPDQFSHDRIRLADVDGSGLTDILYLGREHVAVYFNESGNGWSAPQYIDQLPVDHLANVQVVDLLGNGTACLVWSSPAPAAARQPMRYVDLMGGCKPHLLIGMANNLGATTRVDYASSARFYLRDEAAGRPWITKLPFPVHCVEKVTVTEKWRRTRFSTSYSYHHGYFDGVEREFRGFGRVEQVDVEDYGVFAQGNAASPYITSDQRLYQPPVKTITWFHTGAALDRQRILTQFQNEYFPNAVAAWPGAIASDGVFGEKLLPEPDLESLSADEWREALRACKGMTLRQEVYELDIDALHGASGITNEHAPVRLYSASMHNCGISLVQPHGMNRHAVFLVTESEALTYQYELDLRGPAALRPDPRITHTLNLSFDDYGNVQQSIAVGYPRLRQFADADLAAHEDRIRAVQAELHVAYSETHYTLDLIHAANYRLRAPCEVQTYELTGVAPAGAYFDLADLLRLELSLRYPALAPTQTISRSEYHQLPQSAAANMRLVQHARTLFFDDSLEGPLPLGTLGALGLPYEQYKLALTDTLLDAIFTDGRLDAASPDFARGRLRDPLAGGYVDGTRFFAAPPPQAATEYWMRSGAAGFALDAAEHFYLPERFTDPFDVVTTLEYDGSYDLFLLSSTDALGNTVTVEQFDYRVLAASEMRDPNDNYSAVAFDILGLPVASAVMGKLRTESGDNLLGLPLDLSADAVTEFFSAASDEAAPRTWLGNATARHVYDLGEVIAADGTKSYEHRPASACGIARETHVQAGGTTKIQVAVEYFDGLGAVLLKKAQAEPNPEDPAPDAPLRWIASGKTVLNNKGKPVKQYEPYFSSVGHSFEEPQEEGVTAILYYDAAGRTIRTELPDGSYSRVEFSGWQVTTFDQSDTVLESGNAWFAAHNSPLASADHQRAAQLTAAHADTPASTFLDSLGRECVSVARTADESFVTFTRLDAQGKALWIRDARNNLVMQYIVPPVPNNQAADPVNGFVPCYDIAGNLLFQHSMDAGGRWMLNDAAGQPLVGWDSRGFVRRMTYDPLRRATGTFVTENGVERLAERTVYGEALGAANNHRTRVHQVFDGTGLVTSLGFDFKGNVLQSQRELLPDYKSDVDWQQNPVANGGVFASSTSYDALNRPVTTTAPDGSVYRAGFNRTGLLKRVDVNLSGAATATPFVAAIHYDAKAQRQSIVYGNGARTRYQYDPFTFRLTHLQTTRGAERLQDLFYTFDPSGNITQIRDDAQQTVYFNGQVVEPHNEYEYDALYRLIQATGREHIGQTGGNAPHYDRDDAGRVGLVHPNDGQAMRNYTEQYAYDGVGNIVQWIHEASGGNWSRDHIIAPQSNRLLQTTLPASTFADYEYDAHGNMIQMSHLPLMRWNFKDQLQATSRQVVNEGAPETTWYVYDASGQRVRKVTERAAPDGQTPTRKDERIYLGAFEIYREYGNDGASVSLERETLHVMDDTRRIAMVETRTAGDDGSPTQLVRYQFGNHLGSASLELDDQAGVISYEEYTPYGGTAYQAVSSQTVSAKRYRFTGMERDEETGLNYHSARYFIPWLGRWASADPAGIQGGMNLYGYGSARPIKLVDLEGMEPQDPDRILMTPAEAASGLLAIGEPPSPTLFLLGPRTYEEAVDDYEAAVGAHQDWVQANDAHNELKNKMWMHQIEQEARAEIEADAHKMTQSVGDGMGRREGAAAATMGSMFANYLIHDVKPNAADMAALGRAGSRSLDPRKSELNHHPHSCSADLRSQTAKSSGTNTRNRYPTSKEAAVALKQEAKQAREQLKLETVRDKRRNVALLNAQVDGKTLGGAILSGKKSPKGTIEAATNPHFEILNKSGAMTRKNDTEAKGLEHVAENSTSRSTGSAVLYTERVPCESCAGVTDQFRGARPGIELEVVSGMDAMMRLNLLGR